MDPPYIRHNSRYVLVSSPPPPPQKPNLYGPPPPIYHHQQPSYLPPPLPPPLQQILPPPQPQPQPLQHHYPPVHLPAPTPPSQLQKAPYNSHNSPQFGYDPNFSPNPNFKPPAHNQYHHERSDDFARRIPIENDRRLYHPHPHHHHHRQRVLTDFDARANRLDHPPRNLPDQRLVVNNLDHRQHQFDHRPMSPFRSVDKIKHELDASSYRFRERERYNNNDDGFEFEYKSSGSSSSNQRLEFVSHRSHFVSDSDRLNPSNYNNQHGSQFDSNELMRNNVRDGVFDRQGLREREVRDSLIERGSNSENGADGVRVFSGKREFYRLDSGRYVNNRGSRENSYEYNRTPRKQVQKKSVLLRIQRPYYKNRDDGELHYSGYEGKSGSFRGKDPVLFSDRQVDEEEEEEEEEREGSPVELDVSFKSNSLVAKAIAAPLSSAIVSDTNLMPKNGNARTVIVSDKDHSSSKLNKPPDSIIKLDGSRDAVNNASVSDFRDSKQSKKEVAPSGINRYDNSSKSCSSGSNISPAKITVGKSKGIVSDKLGPGVDTSNISSVKVAKKKKVVKIAVKKPIYSTVNVSSSQPAKKLDEPLKADGSTVDSLAAPVTKMCLKPSKKPITSAMASGHPVDMHPYPDEANILPGIDKVGGSALAVMISKEGSTNDDSHVSSATKIKRKSSGPISPLPPSSHEESKVDEVSINADNCLHVIRTVSSTNKDLTKSLNEITVSDICTVEGYGKKFCHNERFLLLENSATKETLDILTSAGRSINSDFLSLEENKGHESLVNTGNFVHWENTTTSFNNGSLNSSQEKMINPDAGNMNAPSEQPCKGQMSPLVNSSTVEGYPVFILPGGRCEISALSSSEEVGIHYVSMHANGFIHDKCSISCSENVNTDSEEMNVMTDDCNGKQLAQNEVNASLENGSKEGFPNTVFSVGSSEGKMPNTANKSKIMTSLSDLPDAVITDMFKVPVKAVSSEQCVDAILNLSVKDFNPAEDRVTGSLDGSLQSCSDGLRDLRGDNSSGGCCEANVSGSSGLIGTSLKNRKRRKVSACHPGFTGVIVSEISEGPVTPDPSSSGAEFLSNSNEGLIQPKEGVAVSNMDALHDSDLPPCPDGITVLSENCLAKVSSGVAVSVSADASRVGDDGLKVEYPKNDYCSAFGESDIASAPSCPGYESKQIANENTVMDETNCKNDVMCMESSKSEKTESVAAQFKTPSQHQSSDLNQILPSMEVEPNGCFLEKGDLLTASTYPPLAAAGDGVSTTNSNDEMMEIDSLSDMVSSEVLSSVPVMCTPIHEASTGQISNEKVCGIDKISNEKPVDEGIFNLSAHTSPSEDAKINLKSDNMPSAQLAAGRTVLLPSQDVKVTGHNLNPMNGETYGKKNPLSHAVSRSQLSSSFFSASRNAASSTHIRKPRTWHRMENSSASPVPVNKSPLRTVPPQNQLPVKVAKSQNMSYIRKGNSLVRKPAPGAALPQVSHGLTSSVHRLNSSGISESKKTTGSNSSADVIEAPNALKMGGVNAPLERPRTPPLPIVTKVPNQATNSTGDCRSSPLAMCLPDGCSETISGSQKFTEIIDEQNFSVATVKISETSVKQIGLVNGSESPSELNDGTSATSNVKRITYVKRKSNQLVAASNDFGLSVQNPDKTQGFTSDGYYKRRKNQLIRTSLESHINQTVTLIDGSLTSEGEKAPKDNLGRSFSKRQSYKALKKICKPLRFSLVWTLNSMQSSKNDDHSLYRQKVLPYLIPWKRAAYRRCFVQDSISISNNSSLSAISRKLLTLRKRDTVYTRSRHGFSLRKSKVLSVGGSSLKWSKSIENRSKKANEEATLAVAAVERKKKQQIGDPSFASKTKNRSHSSRNRIFRIGSVRYKMDSSRRTLQRISDDESSSSAAPNSEKNANKSYIPRRLVIGNDEYVRIGNGNQLIRDPKKRARILASDKVRWSLHTARLRLARKRKYCQFFTRFGKCNKDDGKCPYIHDPSKIAVCTKFLNGLCSNSNCKLTHKVIPERMPDCSYFLRGLCTNKNCPYRHVHVNPSASTCEAFLKGYCADGNECRKKHSYVCPTFEATGSCPEGAKCKLHHPKSQSKGKKSRRSRKQKSTRGRYFGSMPVDDSEPRLTMSERHSIQDSGNLFIEGKPADFICLDVSDGEAGQTNDALNEQTTFNDSDDLDLQLDNLDELIKPIRIMNCQVSSFSPG